MLPLQRDEASITTADIRKFGEDVNKLLSGYIVNVEKDVKKNTKHGSVNDMNKSKTQKGEMND